MHDEMVDFPKFGHILWISPLEDSQDFGTPPTIDLSLSINAIECKLGD